MTMAWVVLLLLPTKRNRSKARGRDSQTLYRRESKSQCGQLRPGLMNPAAEASETMRPAVRVIKI